MNFSIFNQPQEKQYTKNIRLFEPQCQKMHLRTCAPGEDVGGGGGVGGVEGAEVSVNFVCYIGWAQHLVLTPKNYTVY